MPLIPPTALPRAAKIAYVGKGIGLAATGAGTMEDQELKEAVAALAGAVGAIGERLERDLAEREKLVEALNRSISRIATLEEQLGNLAKIVASMRDLH
jgi:signal transduction histidine kinase